MGLYGKVARANEEQSVISSELDSIVGLVRDRGPISMLAVANELKLPIQKVELWSRKLESKNLLRITYPVIGRAMLCAYKNQEIKTDARSHRNNLILFTIVLVLIAGTAVWLLVR